MASRVEVSLVRPGPGSWGLRLQGGLDIQKALSIMAVTEGSPSQQSGLKAGDVLLAINGSDCCSMTHKAAQDAIVASGHRVELVVQRWTGQAEQEAPGVWRPQVQSVGGLPAHSLAKPPPVEEHWDVKHNTTAKAFSPGDQAQGFRSVAAPVTKVGGPTAPTRPQLQVCWLCTKPIVGAFLQVKGRPTHADCFVCGRCRASLRNVGHCTLGDQMVCEACAREGQGQAPPQGQAPGQGLAASLAMAAGRPQGPLQGVQGPLQGVQGPLQGVQSPLQGAQGQGGPGSWGQRLEADSAGGAASAEDFTAAFMQQLAGGK